jgi:hypothetical protein
MKQGSTNLTVRIDLDLHRWLKSHAGAVGLELREIVTQALEQYRSRIERKKLDGGK